MTTDELRAAAERILENTTREDTPTGPQYQQDTARKHWFLQEPYELARAYLAEHPADDAEPVTDEWAASQGWAWSDFLKSYLVAQTAPPDNRGPVWVTDDGQLCLGATTWKRDATRGDVRRLCAVLGITPAPEATHES